jgi:DNA-binding HxlR family transcriptional regulator
MKRGYNLPCNIAQVLNLIGDRWTMLIIRDLLEGKTTFNELKQSLDGISANILSERLRSLEKDHLITCHLYSEHPPRYEYKLSEAGQQLSHVMNAITSWGQHYLDKPYTKIKHNECEHEVVPTYYCSHCDKIIDDLSIEPISE